MANWESAPLVNQTKNKWEEAPLINTPPKPTEVLKADEGLGSAIKERVKSAGEIKQAYKSGDIGAARAAEQAIGKVGFGAMSDIAGAAVGAAGKVASAVLPEKVTQDFSKAKEEIENSKIGQAGIEAIKSGAEIWNNFKTKNPNLARDIESIANIAGWLMPAKVVGAKAASKIPSIEERKIAVQAAYAPLEGKPLAPEVSQSIAKNINKITPKTEVQKQLWADSGADKVANLALKSVDFTDLRAVRSSLQEPIRNAYKNGDLERMKKLTELKSALTNGLEKVGGDDFIKANHAAKVNSTIGDIEDIEFNIESMSNPAASLHTRVRNYYDVNEKFLSENQKKALKDVLDIGNKSSLKKTVSGRLLPRLGGAAIGHAIAPGVPVVREALTVAGAHVGENLSSKARQALLDRQLEGLNKFKEATYALEPPLKTRSTTIGSEGLNKPTPLPTPAGYLESPETIKNREFIRGAQAKEKGYQQRQIVSRAKQAAEASIKPRPTIPMTGGQALLESPEASSRRRIVESGVKKLKKQKTLEQIKRGK